MSLIRATVVLFTFIVIVQYGECSYLPAWFPEYIMDTVSNKTSAVKEYVRSFPEHIMGTVSNKTSQVKAHVRGTGRSIKNFYLDNVKNKITSYFASDDNEAKNISNKEETINNKFQDYINEANIGNTELFENIAPEKMDNNCHDGDPSISMTTPQLIALHGYAAQSHTVRTEDGYLLTVHRIPFSKNQTKRVIPTKTVLLHHGVLGTSADWVLAGPEKGLAYILSDAGYDVWMANVRGNTYSRAHQSRSIDTFAFWNFTFHEVSQYDLPAVIDFITDLKGRDAQINYVGHSMGTTVLFALLSTKPEYNKVMRAGYALAPIAFMSDVKGPIKILARFADNIEYLVKLLGNGAFLPQNAVLRWLSKHACEINHYEEVICENTMFILCGHDEQQFNRTLLPIIMGHVPAGASSKTLVHYAQEIRNEGRFQQFDYGPEGNLKEYGSKYPPEYPVEKITLPMALLSAGNDWLAGENDVNKLFYMLPNAFKHYIVPMEQFNHIDFLWAVDAPKLVYKKLLELMETDNGTFPSGDYVHKELDEFLKET